MVFPASLLTINLSLSATDGPVGPEVAKATAALPPAHYIFHGFQLVVKFARFNPSPLKKRCTHRFHFSIIWVFYVYCSNSSNNPLNYGAQMGCSHFITVMFSRNI